VKEVGGRILLFEAEQRIRTAGEDLPGWCLFDMGGGFRYLGMRGGIEGE